MEGMEEELQTFLQHLMEFGFVFLRKRSCGRFYPTKSDIGLDENYFKLFISLVRMVLFYSSQCLLNPCNLMTG